MSMALKLGLSLQGLGGPGTPPLPSGANVVLVMSDYQAATGSSKACVPNRASATPPNSLNIFNAPRRTFATGTMYGRGGAGIAVTDNAVAGPDGNTYASTVVGGANDWSVSTPVNFPGAGTYVLCVDIRSHNGLAQTLRQGLLTGMVTQNITTTWTRFTCPVVATGSGLVDVYICRSPDGTTAGSIEIDNACLFAGSSDLGADALNGHMYLGKNSLEGAAASAGTISGGIWVPGTNGFAYSQLAAKLTFAGSTLIAIARKTRNVRGSLTFAVSSGSTNNVLNQYCESTGPAATFNGTGICSYGTQNQLVPNLWKWLNVGWVTLGSRYDGATGYMHVDDMQMFAQSFVKASVTVGDFWLGTGVNSGTQFLSDWDFAAFAIWNRCLSASEYATAVTSLQASVSASGVTPAAISVLIAEGDSITRADQGGTTSGGYVKLAAANLNPPRIGYIPARDGALLAGISGSNSVQGRVLGPPALTNNVPPTRAGTRKIIFSDLIGHNDQSTVNTATFLTQLAADYTARKAAGYTDVVVCTVLISSGSGTFETWRQTVNTAIKAGVGTYCDRYVDFDTITGTGTGGTASISGTTLTFSSLDTPNNIAIGQTVAFVGVTAGTTISSGSGLVWTVNNSQTAGSQAMCVVPWTAANLLDEVHPNDTGYGLLEPAYTTVINAIG